MLKNKSFNDLKVKIPSNNKNYRSSQNLNEIKNIKGQKAFTKTFSNTRYSSKENKIYNYNSNYNIKNESEIDESSSGYFNSKSESKILSKYKENLLDLNIINNKNNSNKNIINKQENLIKKTSRNSPKRPKYDKKKVSTEIFLI